jgi:hypothetical protein
MKSFSTFVQEQFLILGEEADANASNSAMGDAYEAGTALHIHNATASKSNPDKAYQSKITALKAKHKEALSKLSPEKHADIAKKSKDSATAYLKSLHDEEGISPEHIHEIHHTSQGISQHIGRDVSRAANPHDIVIKGKKNKKSILHGASLKATSGTASNNPAASFERQSAEHGMSTGTTAAWAKGKKKAGLVGKTAKDIKAVRKDETIIGHNRTAQYASANQHVEAFNNASHEEKQAHIKHFLKATPDLPYHYVVGEKGGKSTPIENHPAVAAINKSKSITATAKNGNVHFHNEKGEHIATAEHRTTHGAFSSPQVNFKFGTVKAKQ